MFLDVIDRLSDGLDLFGFLVGDGQLELVLELHHEFYGVEGVGVQVVDEVRLAGDLALIDAHLLADDLNDLLIDVFHGSVSYPVNLTRPSCPNRAARGDRKTYTPPCPIAINGTPAETRSRATAYITIPPSTQITCPVM